MTTNFKFDIEKLVSSVPNHIWQDKTLCGLLYDIFPWHGYSAISLQTNKCNERDPASWKYFEVSKSNGKLLESEFSTYNKNPNAILYHSMLCEAGKSLLEINLSSYNIKQTVFDFHLYAPFKIMVYDPDKTFNFNYCEFILASRIINT